MLRCCPVLLLAVVLLSACGTPDPEQVARDAAFLEQRDLTIEGAIARLDAAAVDEPELDTLLALFPLTDGTAETAFATVQQVFPYGPPQQVTIAAMANLLLGRQRQRVLEAAFASLEPARQGAALDDIARPALRWLVGEISNLPMVLLAVPVQIPDGEAVATIGYVEARDGLLPGQAVVADAAGLERLLPYLRRRLLRE